MNHFKDMCDFGIPDTFDIVYLECIGYCSILVICKNLDEGRTIRYAYSVCRNHRVECPAEKPEVLFFQPGMFGARDRKIPLETLLN